MNTPDFNAMTTAVSFSQALIAYNDAFEAEMKAVLDDMTTKISAEGAVTTWVEVAFEISTIIGGALDRTSDVLVAKDDFSPGQVGEAIIEHFKQYPYLTNGEDVQVLITELVLDDADPDKEDVFFTDTGVVLYDERIESNVENNWWGLVDSPGLTTKAGYWIILPKGNSKILPFAALQSYHVAPLKAKYRRNGGAGKGASYKLSDVA